MYEIRFKGSKVKKQFEKLLQKLSQDVKRRMREALEINPYPSPTYGATRNVSTKIEKKGSLFSKLKTAIVRSRMELSRRSRAERSEEKEETPTVRSGEIHIAMKLRAETECYMTSLKIL